MLKVTFLCRFFFKWCEIATMMRHKVFDDDMEEEINV